jgi:hypothetical protein
MNTGFIRSARMLCVPLMALAAACSSSSSATQPSSATGSVTAPRPLLPATNAQIVFNQPVTLVVQNALVTQPGGTTYAFEVATDLAFATKVQTKSGVAEGTNGQTGVALDALTPNTIYFWHARATAGGTVGVFGTVFSFKIGPAVILNAPVPIAPLSNSQAIPRPAFRVANAVRSGPAGPITYKFEVSTTSTFATLIVTGTMGEGVNETGFIPSFDLPTTGTLYWRATAIDALNGITSTPSAVQNFTANQPSQAAIIAAQQGVVLWPGVQPPGSLGHAKMGIRWGVEQLVSFDGVQFLNPPLEELQVFDLLDRGLDPQAAIDWMNSHGYSPMALYYPAIADGVIGFRYEYMALSNGQWDITIRAGA